MKKFLGTLFALLIYNSQVSAQTFQGPSPYPFYNFKLNGGACDDVTDDTAAFNALLLNLNTKNGGTIFLPSMCLISGAILFPNDSASSPNQKSIRITGQGYSANGYWVNPTQAQSGLDLRYNAPVAKLDTRGSGVLEIDHLVLKDGGSDCATFIQTTNTTLNIHEVQFTGTHAQGAACNNLVVFGGSTGAFHVGGASTDSFQGYGTVVRGNWADKCQTFATFNTGANNVVVDSNTISLSCGASSAGIAAMTINSATGNIITNNLIEIGSYYYGFRFNSGANNNFIVGNGTWDFGAGAAINLSDYYCPSGGGNVIEPAIVSNTTFATVTGNNCAAGSSSNVFVSTQNGGTYNHYGLISTQNFKLISTAGLATLPLGVNGDAACIEMQNSDNTNVTNYITALNGILVTTAIKPAACR